MPNKPKRANKGDTRGQAPEPSRSKKARVEENPPLNFASPRLLFQSLIGSVGVDEFFRQYWEQKPYVLRCSDAARASYYRSLFRFADLEQLCARGICYATDLNVCRCVHGKKKVLNKEGRVKFAQLKKDFVQKKATIQLHQPQRFKDELWRIQERLECFFGSLVGSNVYITPPGSQGLPPHYDDVEVLILQLEGKKRWRLYEPTNPLAREYSLVSESHMGPPTHDFLLQTGDLLYFPRGTIHQAETPEGEDHSTHITLSSYQNMSWGDWMMDVFPGLVFDVMKSEQKLRCGLPLNLLMSADTSPDVRKQMCETLRLLADDLEQEKCEFRSTGMKRDFISSRLPPYLLETPAGPAGNQPTLEDDVCLLFKEHLLLTLEPSQEQDDTPTELVVFVLHSLKNKRETHMMGSSDDDDDDDDDEEGFSQGLRFPGSHLTALRQLLGSERLAVKDLQLQQEPDKLGLVLGLWVEGLLQVC